MELYSSIPGIDPGTYRSYHRHRSDRDRRASRVETDRRQPRSGSGGGLGSEASGALMGDLGKRSELLHRGRDIGTLAVGRTTFVRFVPDGTDVVSFRFTHARFPLSGDVHWRHALETRWTATRHPPGACWIHTRPIGSASLSRLVEAAPHRGGRSDDVATHSAELPIHPTDK